MKVKQWLGVYLMATACLFGCQTVEKEPEVNVPDTLSLYLDAIKKQDGLKMSEHTVDGHGLDFSIDESDAQAVGMNVEIAKDLYQYVLDFTYELVPATINEKEATITAHISAYPIEATITKAVEDHKEEFGKINGEDIGEDEKNNKIARIITDSFKEAERSYTFDYTFHLVVMDQEWKVKEGDGEAFYQALFAQK